jgi:hypothetical protein
MPSGFIISTLLKQVEATEEDNIDITAEQEVGDGSKPCNGIKNKWEKYYKKDFAATQVSVLHFPITSLRHIRCSFIIHIFLSSWSNWAKSMYCSFQNTGNHLGLPKNMIQHLNTKIYGFV